MSQRTRIRKAIPVVLLAALGGILWWLVARLPVADVRDDGKASLPTLPTISELSPDEAPLLRSTTNQDQDTLSETVPGKRLVRIIDADGAPVAGAEVGFDLPTNVVCASLMTCAEPVLVQYPLSFDVEAHLADRFLFRTAVDGTVELPTGATVVRVCARRNDDHGQRIVTFDGLSREVPEIVVAPDRLLRVRVVDGTGKSRVAVPVQVSFQAGEDVRGATFASVRLEPSDEHGVTVLRHAQSLPFWDRAHGELTLRPQILAEETAPVRVQLTRPLPDLIDLPCPPHGSIRVRMPSVPGGLLAAHSAWLALEREPTEDHEMPVVPGNSVLVALGKVWKAGALGYRVGRFTGPTHVGERITVDLLPESPGERIASAPPSTPDGSRLDHGDVRPAARSRLATGRVVDAAGAAMSAWVWAGENSIEALTRTNGAFEIWSNGTETVAGIVEVAASAWGHGTVRKTVPVGSTDVVLELRPLPYLTAQVRTDSDTPAWALDVSIHQELKPRQPYCRKNYRGGCDCTFRVADPTGWPLTIAGMEGQRPLLAVTSDAWQPAEGGHRVVVDLRGMFDRVTALFEGPGTVASHFAVLGMPPLGPSGEILARPKGSSDSWGRIGIGDRGFVTNRATLVAPKGSTLEAIVRMWSGPAVACDLHAGENVIQMPPAPQAVVDVEGLPPEMNRAEACVDVWLIERREPLLDQIDGPSKAVEWPPDRGKHGLHADFLGPLRADGDALVPLGPRGRYMAALRVGTGRQQWLGSGRSLLDGAIPLEVTTAGETVRGTIHLDPEQVRKALSR